MLITKDEIDIMPVRALSWKQPYATMMLHGKAETRIWSTDYRGLVLICSSLKPFTYNKQMEISGAYQLRRMKEKMGDNYYNLINAHAIAIGRLNACKSMEDYAPQMDRVSIDNAENLTYVKFYKDLFVFEFKDVRPINPIPWKGSQKWRNLTDDEKKQIILL